MEDKKNKLGEIFEKVVKENNNKIAIKYPNGLKIKYKELDKISTIISKEFEKIGLKKGDVILIEADKSFLMFATLIAAIKQEIIYSLYDGEMPEYRIKKIINTCKPKLIITRKRKIDETENYYLVEFEEIINSNLKKIKEHNNKINKNIVYIVYTSGTTGNPKGATMTQENVVEFINWSQNEFKLGHGEILSNLNPCYFDNFVFDFYAALFTGATIVPISKNELREPYTLLKIINAMEITSWFSVPSLLIYLDAMKAFDKIEFPFLKRIIFGGEGYPKAKLINIYKKYSKNIDFFNVYGPSECTCIASCYKTKDEDFQNLEGFLPLGNILPYFKYYIINEENELIINTNKGELCLEGPAVGLGYYNQKELTEKSFINKNKIKGLNGTNIIYKTGDLVSRDEANNINIFGRKDNQIKHMGYRIELEEIENALMQIKEIKQALCIYEIKGLNGSICAILATDLEIQPMQIKRKLLEHLPKYMIPTKFKFIDQLEKNKNGKIDRSKYNKMEFKND